MSTPQYQAQPQNQDYVSDTLAIAALVVGYTYSVIWAIITISLFSTDGRSG
jgi:hypothetical protein